MIKTQWKRTLVRLSALLAVAAAATGCLQLELAIEMHDKDGGATLTERIRFSQMLLNLEEGMGGEVELARHLGREAAMERMEKMGAGIALESHAETALPDGSRESVAVYRIPDIEALRLPNPFLEDHPPGPVHRLKLEPTYRSRRSAEIGTVRVRMVRAESTESLDVNDADAIPADTPLDLQRYRDLQPVFAHLMKDFEVTIALTVPNQPGGRRRREGDRTIALLHFNDRHMDQRSEPFLQNEEAMLSLLQFKMSDADITDHTKDFWRNPQLPVHRGRSHYGSTHFRIEPTRHLFKKYFAGRPRSEGGDQ